jgi:hypothetical protein
MLIFLNPLFVFIRSSGRIYIWAIIIFNYTLTFYFTVRPKIWAVIVMGLRIELLINVRKIVLIRWFFAFPVAAATFLPFILAFFFFNFLRVLRASLDKIFVDVHFAIFYQNLNQIILTLIIYLVLASLLTNKLIHNAPYVLMVLIINLVPLVLLSFYCKVSFVPLFLLYNYHLLTILFLFHLNTFLININYFLIWHCLSRCQIFVILYLLFILLDKSFFALFPCWAISFNRTWNWILEIDFLQDIFFNCQISLTRIEI